MASICRSRVESEGLSTESRMSRGTTIWPANTAATVGARACLELVSEHDAVDPVVEQTPHGTAIGALAHGDDQELGSFALEVLEALELLSGDGLAIDDQLAYVGAPAQQVPERLIRVDRHIRQPGEGLLDP